MNTIFSTINNNTYMRIESSDASFDSLLTDFYSVPDFQREYVWDEDEVEQFVSDIYEAFYDDGDLIVGREDESLPEYFIGSLVVYKNLTGSFDLIDGQQRLTTAFLTLCVIRDLLKPEIHQALNNSIYAPYTDAISGEVHYRYKLVLQYDESKSVLEQVARGEVAIDEIEGKTKSIERIKSAYYIIRSYLSGRLASPADVKQFYAAFTQRVKLIRIVTPSLRDALRIFETLNDRGVSLDAMDLLKNLLFIETDRTDYDKLKNTWKQLTKELESCREKPLRFLRYFVMANYEVDPKKELSQDKVYDWFVRNKTKLEIDSKPLSFLDQLLRAAKSYNSFAHWKDTAGTEIESLKNIYQINYLSRQHFVLLLAGSQMKYELFQKLCCKIENLFFCYVLTRESNKTYERNFTSWAGIVKKITTQEQLADFFENYVDHELKELSARFHFALGPENIKGLATKRLRYIIAKVCQFVERKAYSNRDMDISSYMKSNVDLEHILPLHPTLQVRSEFDGAKDYESYSNRLGNLTLLEKSINTSVSNSAYRDKLPGYWQSGFLLTKSLAGDVSVGQNTSVNRALESTGLRSFDTWSMESIIEREKIIMSIARTIWEVPVAQDHAEEAQAFQAL
jgi:uncharacterized protein with ParB-like and HNH nuclease domain